MKKAFLILSFCFTVAAALAQEKMKFMQITTIESVVGGGFGRSKMLITKEDGTQEESDMENLFSLTGINMKNIKSNESAILRTLKSYADEGWRLQSTTPLTLSPNQNSGNGIFMTRYLLVKEDVKKALPPR